MLIIIDVKGQVGDIYEKSSQFYFFCIKYLFLLFLFRIFAS